ncbi:GNAT family N-acetyltransferase [Desulfopila aestuarii]|uniref:Ribosomal protein S18 acetylase RimI n=1 Tax=Desulfopila aestuarii DSM 18488 TaxID=1121416 RepID=A0A1M7Y4N5_9BACT|nr:GNAT family N-acetyltransferase [Desulfopila aestuarii]SHO47294.1 Ribosomal protein S18 acetylase RimI [Desulfopila aestuarii DSM 18488]
MELSNYTLRPPRLTDLDRCFEIETVSYDGDEAATREKIQTRIETYPEGFWVLEVDKRIVGFINSGCTDKVEMTDESFKELVGHDPDGRHNVIMSLVVRPEYQGQGFASILMARHVRRMKELNKSSIQLMCKKQHVAIYQRFGFSYVKASASDHGGMSWHEMVMELTE